jgi:hypothetical protein
LLLDLRDVGMVQHGERLSLTLEARQALGVTGEGVRKNIRICLAGRCLREASMSHRAGKS